jgi:hypothetical protein
MSLGLMMKEIMLRFRRHNDTLISFDLDEINLDYLKPKYKIVLPLNESR